MKNRLWIKIFIPVLIVIVIGGIWIAKNIVDKDNTPGNTSQNNVGLEDTLKDADFSLRSTEAIDFTKLSKYGLPIIVDYGADTCIPCKEMAPVLEKANETFKGKAFIKFINVWDYPNAADNVPVQVIPTQVFFNSDGKPFVPSEELAREIQFDMYSHKDTGEHIFTIHQGGLTEEQMWKILKEMGVE